MAFGRHGQKRQAIVGLPWFERTVFSRQIELE
jgi:hypothetical protein